MCFLDWFLQTGIKLSYPEFLSEWASYQNKVIHSTTVLKNTTLPVPLATEPNPPEMKITVVQFLTEKGTSWQFITYFYCIYYIIHHNLMVNHSISQTDLFVQQMKVQKLLKYSWKTKTFEASRYDYDCTPLKKRF